MTKEKKKYEGTMEELRELTADPAQISWKEIGAWRLASEAREQREMVELFGKEFTTGRHTAELVKDRMFLEWNEKTSPADWLGLPASIDPAEPFWEGVIKDLASPVPLNITFCLSKKPLQQAAHLLRLIGEDRRTDRQVFRLLYWFQPVDARGLGFSYTPLNDAAQELQRQEASHPQRTYIKTILAFIAFYILPPPATQHAGRAH